MRIRILGCGTSSGVPRVDGYWGRCDPANPKNRRRRVSITVEAEEVRVLVDTTPDLREQLLDAGIRKLDAVLFTHDHADHTHGIDDLRGLFQSRQQRIDCYGDAATLETLRRRFSYIFEGEGGYPTVCNANLLEGPLLLGPLQVMPFRQIHGPISSLGYRFRAGDKVAVYSTDVSEFPDESLPFLEGVDLWIIDALRPNPHPSHLHLAHALELIAHFNPARALLTHMNWDMDYDTLMAELPHGVEPAYDGQEIWL